MQVVQNERAQQPGQPILGRRLRIKTKPSYALIKQYRWPKVTLNIAINEWLFQSRKIA